MRRDYRHPQYDEIAATLRGGFSDPAVAKRHGVARKTVSRIRHLEGIPPYSTAVSVDDQLTGYASLTGDGHTDWAGCRDHHGVPQVHVKGRYARASHLLFERQHGRAPVGYVKADCDFPHCLTPSHLLDELGRRTLYLQMRALQGLYGHWTTCPHCGGDWDTHGRVQPNLQIYCNACGTRRTRNLREGTP